MSNLDFSPHSDFINTKYNWGQLKWLQSRCSQEDPSKYFMVCPLSLALPCLFCKQSWLSLEVKSTAVDLTMKFSKEFISKE